MKIRVLSSFFSTDERRFLRSGELLEVSEERGRRMVVSGFAEVVEDKPRRKPGRPPKHKAARPSEDKGAE